MLTLKRPCDQWPKELKDSHHCAGDILSFILKNNYQKHIYIADSKNETQIGENN